MSMFATQADYWKSLAKIAERALDDLGVTPAEARACVERSKANQNDAERYRILRRGQHWSVIDGIGDTLRADVLDAAIDAAMAIPPNAAVDVENG